MLKRFSFPQAMFMILTWWFITNFYMFIGFMGHYDYLERSPLLDYIDSGLYHLEIFLTGLIFGSLFYVINYISENTVIRRNSFTIIILIKTLLYILSLILVGFIVDFIFIWLGLIEQEQLHFMVKNASHHFILSIILFFLVAIILLNGAIEASRKLGPQEWVNLLVGRYHKPKTEQLIFCFIDLKGSTGIAEDLGHKRYSRFIKDCFYELTPSIKNTRARVYQYVGDEVVLYWPLDAGMKNQNCIKAFYFFIDALKKKKRFFLETYGIEPIFKAGMDLGEVTITEVGDIKRELAFHGDVINTAARLEKKCSKFNSSFLTSGRLASNFNRESNYQFDLMGKVTLRGKNEKVEVYSIKRDA